MTRPAPARTGSAHRTDRPCVAGPSPLAGRHRTDRTLEGPRTYAVGSPPGGR